MKKIVSFIIIAITGLLLTTAGVVLFSESVARMAVNKVVPNPTPMLHDPELLSNTIDNPWLLCLPIDKRMTAARQGFM